MSRKQSYGDSLELLLDTICNMFGGVLFMAILIALLIRTTQRAGESTKSSPPETVTAAQYHDAVRQWRDHLQLRDSKQAAVAAQREQLKRLVDPTAAELLDRTSDLEARQADVESEAAETAEALAAARRQADELSAELAKLDAESADARGRLEQATRTLAQEVESRTLTSQLPRLRKSTKSEAIFVLRFGRLYTWHRYDRFGRRVGINLDEMIVVSVAGEVPTIAPNPAAGVPVEPASRADVVRKLAAFDSDDYYIAVVVYDDSFAQFALLKRLLIEERLEYRLMPSLPGDDVRDYGGENSLVQ